MGSRAVVVACRDEAAARERFGVTTGELGIVTTRTGRRFFTDPDLERGSSTGCARPSDAADLWSKLETSWACLDCELMPWSAKAQELLRNQYAAVGSAGSASLPRPSRPWSGRRVASTARADALAPIEDEYRRREGDIGRFVAAYRQYCWPVDSLADLKLAPFHLLATEGSCPHRQGPRLAHGDPAEVCRADPDLLRATPYRVVDVTDPASQAEGSPGGRSSRPGRRGDGGQAFRLHPPGGRGTLPARREVPGREYLRIIYGPITRPGEPRAAEVAGPGPEAVARPRRVRPRRRRAGAVRPPRALRRVHECVFGVLALESEPVDPRL
jgi:protein phosphatase